jgi:hypothetical protein
MKKLREVRFSNHLVIEGSAENCNPAGEVDLTLEKNVSHGNHLIPPPFFSLIAFRDVY